LQLSFFQTKIAIEVHKLGGFFNISNWLDYFTFWRQNIACGREIGVSPAIRLQVFFYKMFGVCFPVFSITAAVFFIEINWFILEVANCFSAVKVFCRDKDSLFLSF